MEFKRWKSIQLKSQGYKHLCECIKPPIIHGKLIWDAACLSWNGAAAAQHSTLCGAGCGLVRGEHGSAVSRARCSSSFIAFLGTEPDLRNALNPSWLCADPFWEPLMACLLYQKCLHTWYAEKKLAPQRTRRIIDSGRVPLCWVPDRPYRILQVSEPCILSEEGLTDPGPGFDLLLMPEALEAVLERRERGAASLGPAGLRWSRSWRACHCLTHVCMELHSPVCPTAFVLALFATQPC